MLCSVLSEIFGIEQGPQNADVLKGLRSTNQNITVTVAQWFLFNKQIIKMYEPALNEPQGLISSFTLPGAARGQNHRMAELGRAL